MIYELNWYTHNDPDELDYFIKDALESEGYDVDHLDDVEMEKLTESFGRPFYETKYRVRWDTETDKKEIIAINGKELAEPLELRG